MPTVTTTGRGMSKPRVTRVWQASTISQAAGIGVAGPVRDGAMPPAPRTVTVTVSLADRNGAPRVRKTPCRPVLVTCRAYAAVGGTGGAEHALAEHVGRRGPPCVRLKQVLAVGPRGEFGSRHVVAVREFVERHGDPTTGEQRPRHAGGLFSGARGPDVDTGDEGPAP